MHPETKVSLNVNGVTISGDDGALVASKIRDMLVPFETEIGQRNAKIQNLDDYIYGDGLVNGVEWMNNSDYTLYNWLERLVDIQTSQLMGRPFRL
jgi:hypothetical protein